jgi:hypothetical protein
MKLLLDECVVQDFRRAMQMLFQTVMQIGRFDSYWGKVLQLRLGSQGL